MTPFVSLQTKFFFLLCFGKIWRLHLHTMGGSSKNHWSCWSHADSNQSFCAVSDDRAWTSWWCYQKYPRFPIKVDIKPSMQAIFMWFTCWSFVDTGGSDRPLIGTNSNDIYVFAPQWWRYCDQGFPCHMKDNRRGA